MFSIQNVIMRFITYSLFVKNITQQPSKQTQLDVRYSRFASALHSEAQAHQRTDPELP